MVKIYCDLRKCLGCKACELACAVEHSSSKDLFSAILEEALPVQRIEIQATPKGNISISCRHCDDAPCVDACITGAMHKENGATVCDIDKCVGCWMCIMACPFGGITSREVALSCDLCPDRKGRDETERYACVEACPTGALFAGEFEQLEERLKEEVISYAERCHWR